MAHITLEVCDQCGSRRGIAKYEATFSSSEAGLFPDIPLVAQKYGAALCPRHMRRALHFLNVAFKPRCKPKTQTTTDEGISKDAGSETDT